MAAEPTCLSEVQLSSFLGVVGQSLLGFRALQFLVMMPAPEPPPLKGLSLGFVKPGVLRTLASRFTVVPVSLPPSLAARSLSQDKGWGP